MINIMECGLELQYSNGLMAKYVHIHTIVDLISIRKYGI